MGLLKSHWDVMAAIDFTFVEVWTKSCLVTFYLLFVMELKTRRVHFAGYTISSHETLVKRMARELINLGEPPKLSPPDFRFQNDGRDRFLSLSMLD